MLITAHYGKLTIDRPRKKEGHRGRFWVLGKASRTSNYQYDAFHEYDDFDEAIRKCRKTKSVAVFDVLTEEMFVREAPPEWSAVEPKEARFYKVYDANDGDLRPDDVEPVELDEESVPDMHNGQLSGKRMPRGDRE